MVENESSAGVISAAGKNKVKREEGIETGGVEVRK